MKAHDDRLGLADHLPPQNLEAERCTLGAILLDNDVLHDIAQAVKPGDFYRDAHQTIYRAILDLYDQGEPIDAVSLADELTRRGQYKILRGDEMLMEIANSVPHAANGPYHASIVRQKSISRQLIQTCTEIIRDGYSNLHTASELLDMAERRVFAISEAEAIGETRDIGDVIGEVFIAIEARRNGRATGLTTGFTDLDVLTNGFRPGDLVILAARPSQGKTALAMGIAQHAAQEFPGHVLFISLEMGDGPIGERLLASVSRVEGAKLQQPRFMRGDDTDRLSAAAASLQSLRIKIDDTPGRTVTQIGANARRVKSRDGLSLLVVDYLGLIDGQRDRGDSRQEEVARISRRLKQLARELQCPLLCLHQLNRQSEQRTDRRPMLADLRESGQIEADADCVLLLHRPEFYDPTDRPGIAQLHIAKNRNGPTGTVELAFRKECTRFDSLSATPVETATDGNPY